jgi:hypothetical protein
MAIILARMKLFGRSGNSSNRFLDEAIDGVLQPILWPVAPVVVDLDEVEDDEDEDGGDEAE